ncbi:BnaC06g11250D [Brassica napus]|uniref:BnaC06g11250D protein n=1 Tax=Brassica napus TaxID=3708 RepID=A0A078GL86_BRANA|nr:BnaC06g11250D [Brassica napus]
MVLGNDRLDVSVPVEMRCSEPAWLDSTRTHRRQHCFASSSSLRSRFQSSSSPHLFFFSRPLSFFSLMFLFSFSRSPSSSSPPQLSSSSPLTRSSSSPAHLLCYFFRRVESLET